MGQLCKAAVAAVIIGSVSFIAAGPATAAQGAVMHRGGGCTDVDVLGEVGIANGLLGNALNGEGNPGAQYTSFC
ncbi:hypothetical protein BFF78_20620 [Streptomyces fodineus]|uniref:Chaplin domain-containing protein n=1 Tax=Streptomyces fodineus TaxID=1904616 RepID=A0A1D7YCB3_9ACTN|nr:hypothetical protein [Streptomyces fodineus]AOR33146.1 hypothetical protein BFF78_20620 [Streptomyces fodineus]